MDILVNVIHQKLKVATNLKAVVEGSQRFVRFVFNLSSDWDNLTTFAQFSQNGHSYNQYLDANNSAYLPPEIKAGHVTVVLCGTGRTVKATTNYLNLTVDENILVSNAESTEITESLYEQLINIIQTSISPHLVAKTASDMYDTTKLYIYVGNESGYVNGNWYYYDNGTWKSGGVYNAVAVNTDTTLTLSGQPADSRTVGNKITEVNTELSGVKSDLSDLTARTPEMFDSTEVGVDLDLSDGDGNVLARFQNGHIKTKNFDSSEIADEIDSKQDALTFDSAPTLNSSNPVTSDGIKKALDRIGSGFFVESEETSPDLDITDEYGNVLVRYENGGVETSEFRGFTYKTYRSISAKYSNTDLTLTVNHDFKKGDRIVLHIARGATPWAVGAFVTYKEGTKTIVSNKQVDCVWIEHTVTSNVSQVSAVFAASAGIPSGTTVTLEVSLLGDIPIKPTVIKVKQDGSGDYTTLRGALDAIGTKANDVLNPYRIEIYPGTYDVLADYTEAEIQAATYTQTGFVGPKLLNGMYLVGIGRPQDIVLTASLDPNDYSSEVRNAISPLNCQGSCGFENMTIIAENLRYCVHDDFLYCYGKRYKRLVKNCIFRAYGDMAYAPTPATYGAGVKRGGGDFLFQDCDFGSVFGLHTDREMYDQGFIHLVNCKGSQFEMGDIEESNGDGKTIYRIDNCHFEQVYQHYWGSETYAKAHSELIGDSKGLMYNVPAFAIYKTGDVTMCPELSEPLGTVVEHCNTSNRPRWTVATSIETARGVVIGSDSTDCYIQVSGCVPTNRVGITGFLLGNYIGVANGVLAIVQNASDAIGKIVCVDTNGVGHIELNWR